MRAQNFTRYRRVDFSHVKRWLTPALTGRGERMRASGPVERIVSHCTRPRDQAI